MPAPDIRLSSEFDCDLHINILYGVIFYAAFYPPRFRIVFCKGRVNFWLNYTFWCFGSLFLIIFIVYISRYAHKIFLKPIDRQTYYCFN